MTPTLTPEEIARGLTARESGLLVGADAGLSMFHAALLPRCLTDWSAKKGWCLLTPLGLAVRAAILKGQS